MIIHAPTVPLHSFVQVKHAVKHTQTTTQYVYDKTSMRCIYFVTVAHPSPFCATSFLGRIATSRLRRPLSSGVMTFTTSSCSSGALSLFWDGERGPVLGSSPALTVPLVEDDVAVLDERVVLGAGKFFFLSIASTSRWKRRNRASARIRVDSRSIVHESSLTVKELVSTLACTCMSRTPSSPKHTIF